MRINQAGLDDIPVLARLLWQDTHHEEPSPESAEAFGAQLARWWAGREDAYLAFVARPDGPQTVGMAWLALIPRPGAVERMTGDIQTVFVLPEHRGHGIGFALVAAVLGAPG